MPVSRSAGSAGGSPQDLPAETYEEVEDEGGEDAWSLTRNGRGNGF
jgi:hypothetical protein